ncbi:unnamed protein product (macronuclear) [Paramecium tetraurelia]|uniref:Uncharacterized protein n=1 Tax=Paramecium tetraurelia TaxID=5888 RepID=A0CK42_PARTE|nr:uncharacterized protein GSPATT00000872001 [Paramecium tetraurelia]CAK71159.1 unnamed protein product [Paramecium tetraurelia]|eukprot:XP_001438556.1 hypothetical protein (macronuclear) [Paramecium tetraurelia strain d4-2]
MGLCSSKKLESKRNIIVRLEDHVKKIDQNNVHDQALLILYNSRNQRASHLNEPIMSGFSKQFQKTQEPSQKSSA